MLNLTEYLDCVKEAYENCKKNATNMFTDLNTVVDRRQAEKRAYAEAKRKRELENSASIDRPMNEYMDDMDNAPDSFLLDAMSAPPEPLFSPQATL